MKPPVFAPLRPATPGWRAFLFIGGPLIWAAALIVTAYVLRHSEAVALALIVVTVCTLIGVAVLLPMRARRVREEERA